VGEVVVEIDDALVHVALLMDCHEDNHFGRPGIP
jgi:hypothetical protein